MAQLSRWLVEDGGRLTIWVSHQAQHRMRDGIAQAFALDPDQVRVIVPSAGGAFGSKSQVYPEYIVAAHLARLLGRPVRWVEDRAEAATLAAGGVLLAEGAMAALRALAAETGVPFPAGTPA